MTPVKPEPREGYKFVEIAKDQPEYLTLPANSNGQEVETKWVLTWKERLHCLLSGKSTSAACGATN